MKVQTRIPHFEKLKQLARCDAPGLDLNAVTARRVPLLYPHREAPMRRSSGTTRRTAFLPGALAAPGNAALQGPLRLRPLTPASAVPFVSSPASPGRRHRRAVSISSLAEEQAWSRAVRWARTAGRYQVQLTPEGNAFLASVLPDHMQRMRRLMAGPHPDERQTFVDHLVEKLRARVEVFRHAPAEAARTSRSNPVGISETAARESHRCPPSRRRFHDLSPAGFAAAATPSTPVAARGLGVRARHRVRSAPRRQRFDAGDGGADRRGGGGRPAALCPGSTRPRQGEHLTTLGSEWAASTSVSPRVSGQVARVTVIDNQTAKQGDLLVEIDPTDLDAKLALARADLETARAALASAEVNLRLTEANSAAGLRQARGSLDPGGLPGVGHPGTRSPSRAEVESAQAAFRLAQLDLSGPSAVEGGRHLARRLRRPPGPLRPGAGSASQAQAREAATGGQPRLLGRRRDRRGGSRLPRRETAPDQVKSAEVAGAGCPGPRGSGPGLV